MPAHLRRQHFIRASDMTSNLNAQRLLKAYRSLAARGYVGGAAAFEELADLAASCLAQATTEQRLPAMVLQNVFVALSRRQMRQGESPGSSLLVPPELHAPLLDAVKFVVSGGTPVRCIEVSERLIRAAPFAGDEAP